MVGFLRDPVTIIRGRKFTLPVSWYSTFVSEGSPLNVKKDLTGYSFICDFKYLVKDPEPVITLYSTAQLSPPENPLGISISESGDIILTMSPDESGLFTVNTTTSQNDFPFRRAVFEIKYFDPEGNTGSLMMGSVNVYEKITTSDDV